MTDYGDCDGHSVAGVNCSALLAPGEVLATLPAKGRQRNALTCGSFFEAR